VCEIHDIHRYRAKEEVLIAVKRATGMDLETIRREKGDLRRIVTALLYKVGGLKGPQIGNIWHRLRTGEPGTEAAAGTDAERQKAARNHEPARRRFVSI
jgi:hypothetical protein